MPEPFAGPRGCFATHHPFHEEESTHSPGLDLAADRVIRRLPAMIATTSTLQWSEEEPPVTISTCHELDQALHKVALRSTAAHPIVVALYVHGYEVVFGLGLPESFVNVKNWEPGTPECCLTTVGNDSAQRGVVFFFLDKRRTEIPRRNLIPTAQARQVVREFFETGRRSTSVKWDEL
jgi:hypothetical protein